MALSGGVAPGRRRPAVRRPPRRRYQVENVRVGFLRMEQEQPVHRRRPGHRSGSSSGPGTRASPALPRRGRRRRRRDADPPSASRSRDRGRARGSGSSATPARGGLATHAAGPLRRASTGGGHRAAARSARPTPARGSTRSGQDELLLITLGKPRGVDKPPRADRVQPRTRHRPASPSSRSPSFDSRLGNTIPGRSGTATTARDASCSTPTTARS